MASKVDTCNLALSHLGVSKSIANFDTEKSEEAAAARLFYDIARDTVLRDFDWPFTTKIDTLALVATDPNTEWAYSYRYPTDCLKVRRILSTVRNDDTTTRVPYRLSQDTSGILLFTDMEDAQVEYTVKSENPQLYPPDFVLAFSCYLASLMAPRLTGGDQFKLGERAEARYLRLVGKAEATAAVEERPDQDTQDPEMIRARN